MNKDETVRPKLTKMQAQALKWLFDFSVKFPQNDYGFNPTYHRSEAAICRSKLAPMGLVRINQVSEFHFRYSITDAGLLALREVSHGHE